MTGQTPPDKYPGTPLWVKVFVLAAVSLVALVVLALLVTTVLGGHAPMPGGHAR